jgi:hypothetical protein
MPVISAYADHPTHPYVRVEVNWADTPSVTHARVLRYDTVTGECTPLRPYICYIGDYLLLSCGHGIFWDTEVPFDHPVYYITEGIDAPCIPASPIVLDTFNRDLVDTWGSTDTGEVWSLSGGTNPGNYDVSIVSGGMHTLDTANTRRHSFITGTGYTDQNIYVDASLPVASATGAGITQWLLGRLTDVNNWYAARLELSTAGDLTLTLCKRIAGVVTDIGAAVTVGTGHTASDPWRIRLNITGSTLSAKAWRTADTEPATWQTQDTDTDLPTGDGLGVADRLETGSGNSPLISSWDNLLMGDPCAPCVPTTADTSATPVTIANDGRFWLKDPVRPCHDRPVPLCTDAAACGTGSGILFLGIGPEVYTANGYSIQPTNRRRPLAVTRPRGDATTALRLQTLTFTDRDELLQLTKPGSPLLFQGPEEYGLPDRYMNVQDVQVVAPLPDLRIQIRLETLPYVTVDRPAGPTQGICGARVADICAEYPTWADLAATGLTWDDLVAGQASPESANPDRRTWGEVNAEFADWAAVEAAGRTWGELEEGL